jgi:hypothetical protein
MRTKEQQTLIEDAHMQWSRCDDGTAHIWDMPRRVGALVPLCLFCKATSLGAQQSQPETKGVGPCAKRIALRAVSLREEEAV